MPEVVIREKIAQEHVQAKQQKELNAASNSDWLGQYNTIKVPADDND